MGVSSTLAASAPLAVASITGPDASEEASSPAGFKARIALQNAEGGVHGLKLVPHVIDDRTSPSEIAAAVQEACPFPSSGRPGEPTPPECPEPPPLHPRSGRV